MERGRANGLTPGLLDRRDHLGAGRAAREMGLDLGPLAAVAVAGLEGRELLLVGMIGQADATPCSGDRAP